MLNVSRIFGKAERRRFLLAAPAFVAFVMLWGSASQAQVYLPSDPPPQVDEAPIDSDPDFLKSLTDYAGGGNARSVEHCGGDNCTGILLHRLDNLRVEGGRLNFDYQIRAGQPAGAAAPDISEIDKPDNLGNAAPTINPRIAYSPDIFGTGNWPGGCQVTHVPPEFQTREIAPGFFTSEFAITLTPLRPNILAVNYLNNTFTNAQRPPPTAASFVIPFEGDEDGYTTVSRFSCPIDNIAAAGDGPANVAFASLMYAESNQLTRVNTGDRDSEVYASIAANNYWYYPLDGNPAIIDLEVGGGGDHFYVDVTFSEGVQISGDNPVSAAQFEVHLVGRSTPLDSRASGEAIAVERVTRPGGAPVQAGDTVVRLQLEDPVTKAANAERLAGDPNILVSVWPTSDIIASDGSGAAIHNSGEEWWVRAWYDHRAPYIDTAEIGPGNAHVDITFSQGVKFEVSFDADNQAVMTGTRAPEPEDFEIWFYDRSEGDVEAFTPAAVTDFSDNSITVAANAGVTQLRLGIPEEITDAYEPGDTIDIRTAQRQKDQLHPSLASVFVYGADNLSSPANTALAMYRKNSKFATEVGDTNYPRTAAFAQVGSLALKRTLGVAFDPDDELRVVSDDNVERMVMGRIELIDAASDDAVTVSVDWVGAPPAGATLSNNSIELTGSAPVGTFTVTCGPGACNVGDTGTLGITVTIYKGDTDVDGATLADGVTLALATLPVEVVREIPVRVMFAGDPTFVNARIGGEERLEVTLTGAADALGQRGRNDRITVAFAVEPAGSGVTVSPGSITFDNSGSPQTISLSAGADAMTQLSGLTLVTSATPPTGTPVPVGFTETRIPLKVVPSFEFVSVDGQTADQAFASLVTSVPGSRAVDGGYTIVPGGGALTEVDLNAPVTVIGDVHTCVEGDGEAGKCDDEAGFVPLSSAVGATTTVGAFNNEVHWAAVAGGMVEVLGTKNVYVAPSVGFRTDVVVYDASGSGDIDTGLSAPVDVAGPLDVEIVVTSGEVQSTLDASVTNLGPANVDAYLTSRGEKVLRIIALNDVTFDATRYNVGSGADIMAMIMGNTLLSIGNAAVEVQPLPAALDKLIVTTAADMVPVFAQASMVVAEVPNFKATLPAGSGLANNQVELEATVTVYEFVPGSASSSPTFAISSTPLESVVQGEETVNWSQFSGLNLDTLPANSFVEVAVRSVSPTDLVGSFRFLVTQAAYVVPTLKNPVPGAYAQAEAVALGQPDDITLQNDNWGIPELAGNPVSEIPTGVFDYLVPNLDNGEVVSVVLELTGEAGAGLRQNKYTADVWAPFTTGDSVPFDRVYSAPAPCPDLSASREVEGDASTAENAWRLAHEGVSEGDGCILLQIQEGSLNDADQTRNGVLHDPTALGSAAGRRGGGGGAIELAWLILLAAGVLLAFAGSRRRRRFLA